MERLSAGEASEPPPAPPLPAAGAPPPSTPPGPPRRMPPPQRLPPSPPPPGDIGGQPSGFGTLSIRVQPGGAEVLIDGEAWRGPEQERLLVQVSEGTHHLEVRRAGYQSFSSDVQVRRGETVPLNVSLLARNNDQHTH